MVNAPKIVVAIDSYKGSLSSLEAALAVETGILRVLPEAEIVKIPVADGGEGTLDVFVYQTQGRLIETTVKDPLFRPINTHFGLSKDGKTAFIEVAKAAGLTLIETDLRNPLRSSSIGVGEQIKAALDLGVREFIICLGGSATTDAGAGILHALGARFYSKENELLPTPYALADLEKLDISNLDPRIKESTFLVANDVENPLSGPDGAAFVFGPQKGASQAECEFIDNFLTKMGKIYEVNSGKKILDVKQTGAAGGISASLLAFFNAQLVKGIDLVLDFIDFESQIQGADLIITGEGSLDKQSLKGKTPFGICKKGNKYNIPVVAFAGNVAVLPKLFIDAGFKAVFSIAPGPISLDFSLKNAETLLAFLAENTVNLFLTINNDS